MAKDLYEVLGLGRDASDAEIKSAYRKLAREHHPDVNKETDTSEKFKEVQKAYEILSDKNKRAQYDQFGVTDDQAGGGFGGFSSGFGGAGFSGFEGFDDIFDSFFGGSRRQSSSGRASSAARAGEDLRYDLELNLEDVVENKSHTIDIFHMEACPPCKGSGAKAGTSKTSCQECGGAGQVKHVQQTILGSFSQVMTCPSCQGEGSKIDTPCPQCSGSGIEKQKKNISVDVPAGVSDGIQLRVSGEGNSGRNGGAKGDLYVFISVKPHPHFIREEDDVHLTIQIPMTQAILGTEIKVPTLTGDALLTVPPGTQPNTTFRLKGKGIPHLRGMGKGTQLVHVQVLMPETLSKEDRKDIEALATRFGDAEFVKDRGNIVKGA